MIVKVFHPFGKSSKFCKEKLKLYKKIAKGYDIFTDNHFNWEKEKQDLETNDKLVIILPLGGYTFPGNFIKYNEELVANKIDLSKLKVRIILQVGGSASRYVQYEHQIKVMNIFINDVGKTKELIGEINYGCVPKAYDHLRAVGHKEGTFNKGAGND